MHDSYVLLIVLRLPQKSQIYFYLSLGTYPVCPWSIYFLASSGSVSLYKQYHSTSDVSVHTGAETSFFDAFENPEPIVPPLTPSISQFLRSVFISVSDTKAMDMSLDMISVVMRRSAEEILYFF